MENLSVSRLIGQAWDGNALDSMAAVQITGLLKWIGLILVAAPFVVIAIRTLASVLWPCVRTAWFPMALLVLLAVAAGTDQATDVVRRWGPGQTIWTMLAVALLSVAVGLAGARAFQIGRLPIVVRAQGRPLSVASVGRAAVRILPLAVLTVVALIVAKAMDWRGVAVLAALLGGVYLLSLPLQQFWEAEQTVNVPAVQTAPAPLRQRLGTVLAAAVPLLVGVAVLRAATADVFYKLSSGGWLEREHLMLVLGVALVVIGTILAAVCSSRLIHWTSQGGRVRRYGLLLGLAVIVVLPAALLTLRSTTLVVSQGFGSVAIVLVFLTVLVLVASGLLVLGDVASRTSWARDAVLPPPARLLGFQRPPMVGLLVVWIALASLLGPAGYHDVRLLRRAEVAVDVKTLTTEFSNWRGRQPDSGSGEPLLVVAASGGGLRAAYWTAAVLDCILERNPDP